MSIVIHSQSRTSAQIALEDKTFHELFGDIWKNTGYIIQSEEDLSWAILYKDMFLQVLADHANEGHVSVLKDKDFLIHGSTKDWIELDSPFNNPESMKEIIDRVNRIELKFRNAKHTQGQIDSFNRKLKKVKLGLNSNDPFNFEHCCNVLGLEVDKARAKFKLYRQLKLKYGDSIRIVRYTGNGNKKNLNIPSVQDIIEAEEADGKHDLSLFLHIGVKRELRNRALVRSKNEGSDEGSP